MSARPRQLALDLPHQARLAAEDFLVSPANERAFGFVEAWRNWPERRGLLIGPRGAGKSHLAAIWAGASGARIVAGNDLAMPDIPALVSNPLAVDDIDMADRSTGFHLLNAAREAETDLLLTTTAEPESFAAPLPDLLSRLRALPRATLQPPDDALLRAVLVKLFLDRQIIVDTTLIEYLLPRMERSLAVAARLVAALDREALESGRRVSRAIAARLLEVRQGDLFEDRS